MNPLLTLLFVKDRVNNNNEKEHLYRLKAIDKFKIHIVRVSRIERGIIT